MRILQITPYFYPSSRGTEQTVGALAENLSRLGHEVDILTINTEQAPKDEILWNKAHVHRCDLSIRYRRGVGSFELVRRMALAKHYDLYHIHIPFAFGFEPVAFASLMNHVPLVATHHGEAAEHGFVYGIFINAYNRFYRAFSLRFCRRIIFFTKSYSASLHFRPETEEKIRIIRPAIDFEKFSPLRDGVPIRAKYGIAERDNVILFVGALPTWELRKGAQHLISAMKLVCERIANAKLIIVGEGGLVPVLKTQAKDLGLGGNVIFAGGIFGEAIPNYYAMCDVFVLPSMYETFGYVILEAMATGKPVIACDVPGAGENVQDGVNGLKVPAGNPGVLAEAIIRLLEDVELRIRLGMKARCLIEARSWLDVARDTLEVYGEVIEK